MPELPEVETTIRILKQTQPQILKAGFVDIWTDFPGTVKKPVKFNRFKKEILAKKIKRIWRRGKNIIFELSDDYSLLIHQKLTGHLLYGEWDKKDRANSYIHLKFFLDNNEILALSDLRKFAKVELWKTEELLNSKEFQELGPDPLDKKFTFKKYKNLLINKKIKIKQILMDQKVIAGIGNIYSDEILWRARVHPFRQVNKLTEKELKDIYKNIKSVLVKAVKLGGESFSDYRNPAGKKGFFDEERKVYRREGEKCPNCGVKIKRLKMGGRSAHFCPFCQK
ncbi:MAG: DNA-formamidopyrimidine glycosylase [Candidatus Nealsonbacteria bacterium]|nr:DNA-formamidopyrimidine glycosylase [Candidatus Nealsonbacteria bacterium]